MTFRETPIGGAWRITPDKMEDDRGFFARTWCQREFTAHGLPGTFVQCSTSYNIRRGTLRGMHVQASPYEEGKLVRCTRGAAYDVIVDLRPSSATFRRWHAVELTADNHEMLYIPEGVAHGFQTLVDETEIYYQMTAFHVPEAARGVRWNDPAFGIVWPDDVTIISSRDRSYADFVG